MPTNDAAAPGHDCPGIRIRAIDIVRPPGTSITPIADMDAHPAIVIAALAAKTIAEMPRNARPELTTRSALIVAVVMLPPHALLVAPLGCAVEPLVHAPQAVHAARVGGIRVVHDAVLERERAHARPLARVRGHVRPGLGGDGADRLLAPTERQLWLAAVVVLDPAG